MSGCSLAGAMKAALLACCLVAVWESLPLFLDAQSFARAPESELMHAQWYGRKILEADMGALRAAKSRSRAARSLEASDSASQSPKVAFMFLLQDTAEQEAVWDAFFERGNTSLFSIYVHRSVPRSSNGSFQNLPNSVPVPYTGSDWCALLGVQVAALVEALRDAMNQQFVFVSHNAVPFKGFAHVYDSLMASVDTSKFCFATGEDARGDCRFRDENRHRGARVLKHHQWIVLSRRHAEAVVANAEAALLKYATLRDVRAVEYQDPKMCSDESVPLMALLESSDLGDSDDSLWQELSKLGVEQRCTTFTYWPRCMVNSELELPLADAKNTSVHPHAFDEIDYHYLEKLVKGPLLFGRKFPRGSVVTKSASRIPLSQVLPVMWARAPPQQHLRHFARLDAGNGVNSRL
ncbi:BC10 [Symbiodinium sp. CCMP2592]|nr:BC10 [Symbiodinium sp. CCMP2592]